jgi:hypothetical protein
MVSNRSLFFDGLFHSHMNTALIFWGLLFGSIGMGMFVYGRKQQAPVPLVCGVALMVVPYAISDPSLLLAVGIALVVIRYFVRQ